MADQATASSSVHSGRKKLAFWEIKRLKSDSEKKQFNTVTHHRSRYNHAINRSVKRSLVKMALGRITQHSERSETSRFLLTTFVFQVKNDPTCVTLAASLLCNESLFSRRPCRCLFPSHASRTAGVSPGNQGHAEPELVQFRHTAKSISTHLETTFKRLVLFLYLLLSEVWFWAKQFWCKTITLLQYITLMHKCLVHVLFLMQDRNDTVLFLGEDLTNSEGNIPQNKSPLKQMSCCSLVPASPTVHLLFLPLYHPATIMSWLRGAVSHNITF